MLFNEFRIESVELSPNIVQTDELIVKTAKRWMRVTKALIIAPVKFRMTFRVFSQKENPKNYPSPRGKQRFARELWRRCILFVWKFTSRSIQTLRLVWDCFARELSTWRWRNSNYKKGKLFTFHPEIFRETHKVMKKTKSKRELLKARERFLDTLVDANESRRKQENGRKVSSIYKIIFDEISAENTATSWIRD